jgi:tripartite-type tricarboxylate transporter receptor subunit TctC
MAAIFIASMANSDLPRDVVAATAITGSLLSGLGREAPAQYLKEINAGLTDPKIKERLADLGGTPLVGSPADLGKLIADETEKWGKVIKSAGIKAE